MGLNSVVESKRIALTMGPGGVGKTTVAAALGLQAAVLGRRALVLTVDPAQRLADALGLKDLDPGEIRELTVESLQAIGIPAKAPLHVSMLDAEQAWRGLIQREVGEEGLKKRILEHPFFVRMTDDLSGAREYAAMEELYHLHLRGGFDLLVLDTPPTIHGMDFLESPDRLLDVLEQDAFRWLMRPALLAGRMGLRVLNFHGGYVVRKLTRFTGVEFLRQLAQFIDLFSGLMEGFRARAAAVKATLRSAVTGFVVITAADPNLAQESAFLHRRLLQRDLSPEAVIVNRMAPEPPALPSGDDWKAQAKKALGPPDPAAWFAGMQKAHAILQQLAERDQQHFESLRQTMQSCCAFHKVKRLPVDIHNLAGLELLRRALFEENADHEST
ncbi:MAG: ArsA family ATPase [Deltaproteobacteria bacterium]|nr:ArsA family ATPase [Deltaproteobacteria bacterium]